MNEFYPLTSNIFQRLRDANLTAAQWRLWTYLVELDPTGDRYCQLPDLLEVLSEVDMSKAQFYKAIAKFQEKELFDFQQNGLVFRNLEGGLEQEK